MQIPMKTPAMMLLSLGLVACASQPNQSLEQARSNYSALQSNPKATQMAALETKKAGELLDKAEKAYLDDADKERVDHLSYLANRGVEVAEQTIQLRSAEKELENVSTKRAEARLQAREQEIRQLQQELQAKQTERGTLVTFGDVLFNLDSAELKPGGLQNVQTLAEFLKKHPERQVIIEGYTDSTGPESYNKQLSRERADAVRMALVKMGVDADRIVTQGYGENYPVASNDSPSGRAMNRRVEVTISKDGQDVAPRTSMAH